MGTKIDKHECSKVKYPKQLLQVSAFDGICLQSFFVHDKIWLKIYFIECFKNKFNNQMRLFFSHNNDLSCFPHGKIQRAIDVTNYILIYDQIFHIRIDALDPLKIIFVSH